MSSLLSERTNAYQLFGALAAGTTASAAASVTVDLQADQANSFLALVTVGNTTSTAGVSVTLQAGATTAAMANLCTAGTTVPMTAATTVSNRILRIDAKDIKHRYVRLLSNTTSAVVWGAIGIPYDCKKQVVTASSDVATTFAAVHPTTTA